MNLEEYRREIERIIGGRLSPEENGFIVHAHETLRDGTSERLWQRGNDLIRFRRWVTTLGPCVQSVGFGNVSGFNTRETSLPPVVAILGLWEVVPNADAKWPPIVKFEYRPGGGIDRVFAANAKLVDKRFAQ